MFLGAGTGEEPVQTIITPHWHCCWSVDKKDEHSATTESDPPAGACRFELGHTELLRITLS